MLYKALDQVPLVAPTSTLWSKKIYLCSLKSSTTMSLSTVKVCMMIKKYTFKISFKFYKFDKTNFVIFNIQVQSVVHTVSYIHLCFVSKHNTVQKLEAKKELEFRQKYVMVIQTVCFEQ